MERLTFDGNFCDIAQCTEVPGGSFCEDGACSQKKVWERLKAYEDTGWSPEEVTALGKLFDYALKESKTLTEEIALLNHIRELAEADKDGRVLILDSPAKYAEIWALYRFCVDCLIECTIEGLYDGYAIRFPDGSDFVQHSASYGGEEGCVEPAIGDDEFDYSAVGLSLAKELVQKYRGKLEGKQDG